MSGVHFLPPASVRFACGRKFDVGEEATGFISRTTCPECLVVIEDERGARETLPSVDTLPEHTVVRAQTPHRKTGAPVTEIFVRTSTGWEIPGNETFAVYDQAGFDAEGWVVTEILALPPERST